MLKLTQNAAWFPGGSPVGQPFAGCGFRGFCSPGALSFTGDGVWIGSMRGEACPLVKWRGTKKYKSSSTRELISLKDSFPLNFNEIRLRPFKKICSFHSCKFKSLLMPLPLCTHLQKYLAVFRQFLISNSFWGQAKKYFLFQMPYLFQSSCLSV